MKHMELNDPRFFRCKGVGCILMKIRCVERQEKRRLNNRCGTYYPAFPFCQTCEQGKEIAKEIMK